MELKILKKSDNSGEKNGRAWRITSLFVCVDNKNDANLIAMKAIKEGATKEQVGKFIKTNDFNGKTSYPFSLNCSAFTLNKVEKFGVLEIDINNILVSVKDNFVNSRIRIISGKEQVDGYDDQGSNADGWVTTAPESKAEPNPIEENNFNPVKNMDDIDLPF